MSALCMLKSYCTIGDSCDKTKNFSQGNLALKLSYFENGKIFAAHSDVCERSLEFDFPVSDVLKK
jgi:hypothetical protein